MQTFIHSTLHQLITVHYLIMWNAYSGICVRLLPTISSLPKKIVANWLKSLDQWQRNQRNGSFSQDWTDDLRQFPASFLSSSDSITPFFWMTSRFVESSAVNLLCIHKNCYIIVNYVKVTQRCLWFSNCIFTASQRIQLVF